MPGKQLWAGPLTQGALPGPGLLGHHGGGGWARGRRGATLVMPYMVDGCMTVTSGVASRGVLGPNTAIVDGAYTRRLCCAASSSTFCAAQARRWGQRSAQHALRGCVHARPRCAMGAGALCAAQTLLWTRPCAASSSTCRTASVSSHGFCKLNKAERGLALLAPSVSHAHCGLAISLDAAHFKCVIHAREQRVLTARL